MHTHAAKESSTRQAGILAQICQDQFVSFVHPLLCLLNRSLDVRLVQAFLVTAQAILTFRHSACGLLLSELGAHIAAPHQAPAGTKRLDRLLRSPRWSATLVADWLWNQAVEAVSAIAASGAQPFVIWDTSVLEKPESRLAGDLCPVHSSTSPRYTRTRPGLFNAPAPRPCRVPGLHWLGVVVCSRTHTPVLAALSFSTTRGAHACSPAIALDQMLVRCLRQWGRQVWHIWDRGFASAGWLETALDYRLRFVVRWKKGNVLLDRWGEERKAWMHVRGKRSWSTRQVRDTQTGALVTVGVLATPVTLVADAQPMWLVVARLGRGREPWYLLTSEEIHRVEDAWAVVFAYARRWQIERVWRYSKSEMAMESVRVRIWERREKLLLLAALVEAFLLSLLKDTLGWLRRQVLRVGCHRTGKRSRDCPAPLYRLRAALSYLLLMTLPLSRL